MLRLPCRPLTVFILALPLCSHAHNPVERLESTVITPSPFSMERLPMDYFLWGDDPRYLEPRESMWHDVEGWMIRQQDMQSRHVLTLSRGIDRALSGETYIDRDNDSYVRLGVFNRYDSDGRMGIEPEARFRLDLPTVEEKLRLVIESDADDLTPLAEQQQRGTRSVEDQEDDDTFTAGALRLLLPITERWDTSTDVGARLRLPPQAFWRARARSDWSLPDQWNLHLDQRLSWFSRDGWLSRSWLGFQRDVLDHWSFQASSEARWVHPDRTFEVGQVFRVQRSYRNRHFVRYRTGVLGDSDRNWRTKEYFADTLYRNRLYNTWLFGEVVPSVRFRREDSFSMDASLTLRVEMFFSASGSLN